jgi:hypothetical protein
VYEGIPTLVIEGIHAVNGAFFNRNISKQQSDVDIFQTSVQKDVGGHNINFF